jgi:signal transduction histidine kinase
MIADLVQNSVEAGSSLVCLDLTEREGVLSFIIEDNGKGMDEATLEKAKDPFYTDGKKHPGRSVGLGIPFLSQTAGDTGGTWDIVSAPGKGTTVRASFDTVHIDTPPLGDVPLMFRSILILPDVKELVIHRILVRNGKTLLDYEVKRSEVLDALGELDTAQSLGMLREYLQGLEYY